jgi:hypothetical protein
VLEKSLAFLAALFEATRSGALTWRIASDDDHDLFETSVADEHVTVEILHLPGSSGSERAFVRIVGLKTWEVFARGTEGYDTVMRMLTLSIPAWAEGSAGSARQLERATDRIRQLIATS